MTRRAGRARSRLVLGATLLACGVCAAAGGVSAGLAGTTALGLLAGRVFGGAPTPRGAGRWRVANAAVLAGASLLALTGTALLPVGVALVGWLMLHRAWTGRRAADDRVLLLLSLLLVLLGCILSVSPWLALGFSGWAALAPGALLLCHRDAEVEAAPVQVSSPPAVALPAMGLGVLALTAFFYLILPRLPSAGALAGLRQPQSAAGFSNDVALGDLSEISDNQGVVLRVELGGPLPSTGLYFRGAVLDAFDGERWARTLPATARLRPRQPPPNAVAQRIQQEPLETTVIFGLGEVVSALGPSRSLERDAGDGLHSALASEGLSYTVWSVPVTADDEVLSKARPDLWATELRGPAREAARLHLWTQLPADLDPRIPALAKQVVADAGDPQDAWSQARALEDFLRERFIYADTVEPDVAGQSLARFLFETRRGHCEYFGTALSVMLRTLGLPTRLVTGFLGGEWNDVGRYLVLRQQDAHAWVELNLGPAGWVTLDGTPAAEVALREPGWFSAAADLAASRWYQLVLDYDLGTQLKFLQTAGLPMMGEVRTGGGGAALGWLAGAVGLVLSARWGLAWLSGDRRKTRAPASRLAVLHERARRQVARRGWAIPAALPPVAAARWLRAEAGEAAAPLETLAWLLYRSRYGGEAEGPLLAEARGALASLAVLPRPAGHRVGVGPRPAVIDGA